LAYSRHDIPDDANFVDKFDTLLISNRLLHMINELLDVSGASVVSVDNEIGVLFGYFGAADAVPFQP
jgi:hypothetical protein